MIGLWWQRPAFEPHQAQGSLSNAAKMPVHFDCRCSCLSYRKDSLTCKRDAGSGPFGILGSGTPHRPLHSGPPDDSKPRRLVRSQVFQAEISAKCDLAPPKAKLKGPRIVVANAWPRTPNKESHTGMHHGCVGEVATYNQKGLIDMTWWKVVKLVSNSHLTFL